MTVTHGGTLDLSPEHISKAHGEITGILTKYTAEMHHKEFITALYAHILLFEQIATKNGRPDLILGLKQAALTYRTVTGLADKETLDAFQSENI